MKEPIRYAKEKFQKQAEAMMDDPKKLMDLVGKAKEKLNKNKEILDEVLEDLLTLFRLVKSYYNREYVEIKFQTMLIVIIGLIYFVVPTDLVPDFIPVIGLLDDITVIGWAMGHIKDEIEDFKKFDSSA
jgi:uncharacterized membrane protein YkvA (DUF1232 family)